MIEPMELQLNNLVLYEGQEVQVTHISHLIITIKTHKYIDVAPEELMPMQLSPELLERCGFVKRYIVDGLIKYELGTVNLFNESDGFIFNYSHNNGRLILTHLHTLMNLVKTLTGKELKIK